MVVVDGEVSSWKSVLSGVPQGSVLGPILFLVYINDLEEGVTGKLLKFADDTKLFRKVKEIGDKQNLQDNIDKLVKWSRGNLPPPSRLQTPLTSWHSLQVHQRTEKAIHVA